MKKGLVFGKFMPLHKGHLALIDFALLHCDNLVVLLCSSDKEPIPGHTRLQWLQQSLQHDPRISIQDFRYDERVLPNTSVSSREVSAVWAAAIAELLPGISILFSSEEYGTYVADCMGIDHLSFNMARDIVPVSASLIRKQPMLYWDYIAAPAQLFFTKKIAIVGTESTGKTTITQLLATHFNASYTPEMARFIIEQTLECTHDDLLRIAQLHAQTILSTLNCNPRPLFFSDTDLLTTKSYSRFLFNRDLVVDPWIENANQFDLYLFMEPDCPFVQDGTRLQPQERNILSQHHRYIFLSAGVPVEFIHGRDWTDRLQLAIKTIEQSLFLV